MQKAVLRYKNSVQTQHKVSGQPKSSIIRIPKQSKQSRQETKAIVGLNYHLESCFKEEKTQK